jgi:hypothetical protein
MFIFIHLTFKTTRKINIMENRNITQKNVKWMDTDNEDATRSTYHGYYSSKRKFWGGEYDSNRALCNKSKGISDDGESFVHISKVEDNGLKRDLVCGSCLRIFDKLNNK